MNSERKLMSKRNTLLKTLKLQKKNKKQILELKNAINEMETDLKHWKLKRPGGRQNEQPEDRNLG